MDGHHCCCGSKRKILKKKLLFLLVLQKESPKKRRKKTKNTKNSYIRVTSELSSLHILFINQQLWVAVSHSPSTPSPISHSPLLLLLLLLLLLFLLLVSLAPNIRNHRCSCCLCCSSAIRESLKLHSSITGQLLFTTLSPSLLTSLPLFSIIILLSIVCFRFSVLLIRSEAAAQEAEGKIRWWVVELFRN